MTNEQRAVLTAASMLFTELGRAATGGSHSDVITTEMADALSPEIDSYAVGISDMSYEMMATRIDEVLYGPGIAERLAAARDLGLEDVTRLPNARFAKGGYLAVANLALAPFGLELRVSEENAEEEPQIFVARIELSPENERVLLALKKAVTSAAE